MILHFYSNYNVVGGFYAPGVVVEKVDPEEMKAAYVQVIASLPKDTLELLKECDLYCLGKFDNVSGEILPEKTFVLHCGDVVAPFLNKLEVKEDGRKEESTSC